jgi:predicted RNA-binding protein with PIN domain
MATWPDHDLPEQRRRLVDALDQLEARVGVHTTVVFDGVEEAWRRSASRRVDVRFTPAGVEADDVILDLVDALPGERPVVVASDDQRVRTGARQRGAHPIGTAQLRSLL